MYSDARRNASLAQTGIHRHPVTRTLQQASVFFSTLVSLCSFVRQAGTLWSTKVSQSFYVFLLTHLGHSALAEYNTLHERGKHFLNPSVVVAMIV